MNTNPVHFTLNGKPVKISIEPWTTLLDYLRYHKKLVGTKRGVTTASAVLALFLLTVIV